MKLTKFKISLVLLANFFLFLFFSSPAFACGPFFNKYIYTPKDIDIYYPLMENKNLFDGGYGLILSNWGPEYFYPIYMELNGKKLNSEIKKELLLYYDNEYFNYDRQERAVDEWLEARKSVAGENIEIDDYMNYKDTYSYFANCSQNAFLTAKKTLEERTKTYNEEQLKSWVKQQDEVFSNCGGHFDKEIILSGKKRGFLTRISELWSNIKDLFSRTTKGSKSKKELSPEELFEYDKEYQRAAIDFYQGNFETAEEKFKKIVDNYDHPWREYSALVIGRIHIRKASLGVVEKYDNSEDPKDIERAEEIRQEELKKADKEFEKILKDDSLRLVHEGAKNLRNYILFRTDPKARLKVADDILLNPDNPGEIINNMEDFATLWYRKLYRKAVDGEIDEEYKEFEKFNLKDGGGFSQWLYAWWNPEKNNLDLALKKYKKTKSPVWLLASLKLMTPNHSSKDQIIQDAEKIFKDSPAHLTANYYRLRLLFDSDQKEKAKKELDNLLESTDFSQKPLAKNYFLNLRMLNSDNYEEILKYGLRNVVTTYYDYEQPHLHKYLPLENGENILLLDEKIKKTFNESLPLEKWSEAVMNENILTPEMRKQIGLIAFVRAVLLNDWEMAQKMADFLAFSDSDLKNDLLSFRAAENQEDREFATALFILEYFGLNHFLDLRFDQVLVGDFVLKERDVFRRNWWCQDRPKPKYVDYFNPDYRQEDRESLSQFLSEDEIKQAQSENEVIYKVVAPNFLAGIVIDYSLKHPRDPRVPEALHSVVDATHYAQCADEKTTDYSKQAFQLLHNNYPGSYWAKETPYWY